MANSTISALTAKSPPVDNDATVIVDSVGGDNKKVLWSVIKSTLKTYFDGVYLAVAGTASAVTGFSPTTGKTLSVQKSMTLTCADDTAVATLPAGSKTLVATDGNVSGSSGSCTGNAATVTGFSPTTGKTLSVQKTMTLTCADDTAVATLPAGSKTLLATDGSGASLSGVVKTETDPVVGAITGIVKANGAGAISAASAGTDFSPARALQGTTDTATPTAAGVAGGGDVFYDLTALAQAAAFTISGSWSNGQKLLFRIKDNATAHALDFTTSTKFTAVGVILPTTTVISKLLYVSCIYNSTTSKFDVVGVNQEA
jgi:hypothetical protein